MLESATATRAVFFPATPRVSNRDSWLSTCFSYFKMPWTAGSTPVYMVPKHTGVQEGVTVATGSPSWVCSSTGANQGVYFWNSHMPTASGL